MSGPKAVGNRPLEVASTNAAPSRSGPHEEIYIFDEAVSIGKWPRALVITVEDLYRSAQSRVGSAAYVGVLGLLDADRDLSRATGQLRFRGGDDDG